MSVDSNQAKLIEERPGCSPLPKRRALVPLVLTLLLSASALLIASHPQMPIWDQEQLLEARFDGEHLPSPARGFTSQMLVALQASLSPFSAPPQNEQVKILAMLFYVTTAILLARALLDRVALQLLLLGFLFSSQYPFLWLSSELVVGGFLFLTLWSWADRHPLWLTGALAALLALCKPDLILLALVLIAFMAWEKRDRRQAAILLGSFAICIVLLLLPGTLKMGWAYFDTYTDSSGGRSLVSFKQHFAALMASFQIFDQGPSPWGESDAYFRPFFPEAESLWEVMRNRPQIYLDYVALSIARGIWNAGWVLNYALFAIPILIWGHRRWKLTSLPMDGLLVWCFVGFIPFVTMAYPHIRYMARFYPIAILLILMGLERLSNAKPGTLRTALLAGSGAALFASLMVNLGRLMSSLQGLAGMQQYWFPD